ncbi:hypothetical protein J7438_01445 [Thalassotalea sp. G20_0]|uniref:hypothetical protein n=1 Tax=Thalassotalea sp. G20_0 TaxID=2821093 RepID=UPI001ADCC66D|nr:hypothetical protein [Thalassotalea sp. G20_0]MBO9492757.1 hypothetical protein [Thalassotalea sp. G20_0]
MDQLSQTLCDHKPNSFTNTAILSNTQVELIKTVVKYGAYKLTKEESMIVIDYLLKRSIPSKTPPKMAIFIYDHLEITAKIKSLRTLPESFKNDDLYNELICSGMIGLKYLPEHIKNKNKEYCLSQLSYGLCQLSEVPVHFITKEAILDSLNDQKWISNYYEFLMNQRRYSTFYKDPVLIEEVLIKIVTAELGEDEPIKRCHCMVLGNVYGFVSQRYKADEKKTWFVI